MMGKSRKFGMGNPGKMMPDYNRHVVETTAESEGFGSSGRVDTELTLSEDSCSPKRKCISLNGNIHDRLGVPVQVLSLSKMSRSERKDLEVRLKRELEEVRILQKRVASLSMGAVVVSPASDIRSCSDGLKRPPLDNVQRVPDRPIQGKKRLSPGQNGPRVNKSFGPVEPPRQAVPVNSFPSFLVKQCTDLVNRMAKHKFGWVFKDPVDTEKLKIPDYFNVIKHPMDFETIKRKLASGEYMDPQGFAADVRLTFSNAMTYNPPKNDVHIMAQTMSKYFDQRWKAIEKKIPPNTDVALQQPSCKVFRGSAAPTYSAGVQVQNVVAMDMDQIPPLKKKKVAPVGFTGKVEPMKRVMTDVEKRRLSEGLEENLADLPETIIDFLKENCSGAEQTEAEEIELDIDALSHDVLFKIRKMLDDFLVEKKKQQIRAEPCEMELHNESGFSNSSIQPGKGNDAGDEDIDIGGNGHPVTSFPPVEIEKDTANKNSRCSSPSSSGSDSGSSSSDSDSGSSSRESEGARSGPVGDKLQGTLDVKSKLDHDVVQDIGKTQSRNSLNEVEHTPQTKPPSVEGECDKEGESAPSERQVSPGKKYHHAIMKSRFADTILKAQEKTLDKGEKRDPESLRLEREELERRHREEKARLEVEAKEAKEAKRKAEAEAAAEARRMRELEREAARLALQKMEKTVEINENQFMEDLEMLGAAPADDLSSFLGDASPNDSQNGLGSFRFRANSNPLEQLGLYRKDDDEEEEEVEAPHNAPDPPVNDVEEGEID